MLPVLLLALISPALSARLPYIIGGDNAQVGAWPWQASLQYYGSHSCGASLISEGWVLTAAHCVTTATSPYTIVLGLHDRINEIEGDPKDYKVSRIIRHENYGSGAGSFPNDIAVMELSTKAELNDYVKIIKLASSGQDFVGNKDCYITGWGRTSSSSPLPNILQQAQIRVITQEDCKDKYGSSINDGHICVTETGRGACNGDSGGPMTCKVSGVWVQGGLTSFGRIGCPTTYPSVYTRISYFRQWIEDKTGV